MLAAFTVLTFVSGNDNTDYTTGPATNPEGLNVYFDSASASSIPLGATDTEFTITVSRNKTDKAISVPLIISEVNTHYLTYLIRSLLLPVERVRILRLK